MRLLLDTDALLWWGEDNPRLTGSVRALFADRENMTLISDVSLWEIAIKVQAGKLDADVDAVASSARGGGFDRLPIRLAHLVRVARLPRHHRDPFDHLLFAQALVEDAVFVTADRRASSYLTRVLAL